MSKALGLVEVNGYLAAIEAADAALKAAKVTLIGLEKVKSGITTIKITGDVGAVMAAVNAAATQVDKLGMLRATHVIPSVDEQVEAEFLQDNSKKTIENQVKDQKVDTYEEIQLISTKPIRDIIQNKDIEEEAISNIDSKEIEIVKDENYKKNLKIKEDNEEKIIISNSNDRFSKYKQMKVEELRRLVRGLKLPNLTNKQIKFAKKDYLIEVLLENDKAGD